MLGLWNRFGGCRAVMGWSCLLGGREREAGANWKMTFLGNNRILGEVKFEDILHRRSSDLVMDTNSS